MKEVIIYLAEVKLYFQDVLGRKVDLAMRGRLKRVIEPNILQDLVTVYEEN